MDDIIILLGFYTSPQTDAVKNWLLTEKQHYAKQVKEQALALMPDDAKGVFETDITFYQVLTNAPLTFSMGEIMQLYETEIQKNVPESEEAFYFDLTEVMLRLELSMEQIYFILLSALTDDDSQVRSYVPFYCLRALEKKDCGEFLSELGFYLKKNHLHWVEKIQSNLNFTPFDYIKVKEYFPDVAESLENGKQISRPINITQALSLFCARLQDKALATDQLKQNFVRFCKEYLSKYEYFQEVQDSSETNTFKRALLFAQQIDQSKACLHNRELFYPIYPQLEPEKMGASQSSQL